MSVTVRGIYAAGRIVLQETPVGIAEGPVTVVVESEASAQSQKPPAQQMYFGMLRKDGAPPTEWEDFMEAKKIWEPKDL